MNIWKPSLLVVFLFTIGISLFAQTIQTGIVREINSNRQPVAGVQIIFEDAVPTNSDNNGNFRLVFDGKKPGDLIFFTEIKKNGYELVNKKDLEVLKISSNNLLVKDFILAKTGLIDVAKKEYYEVSDKALIAGFEREKKALREQLKKTELNQQEYLNQLGYLQKQYETQKESLDALAEKFARINFDDVSPVYKNSLQLFRKGKIDEAIALFENSNPELRTKQIVDEGKRIENAENELAIQKEQLEGEKLTQYLNIQFLISLYKTKFDYQKVELQYDQLAVLYRENPGVLLKVAEFYTLYYKFDKATKVYNDILKLTNKNSNEDDDILIAEVQIGLGTIQFDNNNYQEALVFYNLAVPLYLKIRNGKFGSLYEDRLINLYLKIGKAHLAMSKLEKAKEYYEKAYELGKKYNLFPIFADINANLGFLYRLMGNYGQSLVYYEEVLRLRKNFYEINESSHFKHGYAIAINLVGTLNYELGNNEKAKVYFESALAFLKELKKDMPQNEAVKYSLALLYDEMGFLFWKMDNSQKATSFFEKQYQLSKELYQATPLNKEFKQSLIRANGNLGSIYHSLNKTKKAIGYFESAIELKEELLKTYPQNSDSIKKSLAFYHKKLAEEVLILDKKNKAKARVQSDTSSTASFVIVDPASMSISKEMEKAFDSYEKIIALEEELYQSSKKTIENKQDLLYAYSWLQGNFYYSSLPKNYEKIINYFENKIQLRKELCELEPQNDTFKFDLALNYESLGNFYAHNIYDRKQAYDYYLLAEPIFIELIKENPKDENYIRSFKNLDKIIGQIQLGIYASKEFIELYTFNTFDKETTEIYNTYQKISDSLRVYMSTNIRYKNELAKSLNSQAWYGFFLQKFTASEAAIREAMALDADNDFLATNLAPALLLQGKFEEAKTEYQKWKNKAFQHTTYQKIFLDDLNTFEKAGIIPPERKSEVESIRELLQN